MDHSREVPLEQIFEPAFTDAVATLRAPGADHLVEAAGCKTLDAVRSRYIQGYNLCLLVTSAEGQEGQIRQGLATMGIPPAIVHRVPQGYLIDFDYDSIRPPSIDGVPCFENVSQVVRKFHAGRWRVHCLLSAFHGGQVQGIQRQLQDQGIGAQVQCTESGYLIST